VIVKKDGSTIVCRVVEVSATEITYKKWSDLNGSNYVMDKSLASAINYENGKKENLSEATNLYAPGNQNDGVQQYNDRALLRIDAASNNPYTKVKTLRKIGWIGGAAIAGAGIVCIAICPDSEDLPIPIALIGGGAAFTTTFLLIANQQKKKIQRFESSAIYKYDFNLSNGSSISLCADMLSDRINGTNTIGLGLRYNF
jgi:hypothetical protein